MNRLPSCLLALAFALLGSAGAPARTTPAPAEPVAAGAPTGLHRCVDGSGVAIFTDRPCDQMQARDAPPPTAGPAPSQAITRVRSCARSQDDLLFGVRNALEGHDPNRLAEYYHWSGMGNAEGYRVMKRLSNFSERPLLDVQLVSSTDPYSSAETDSADAPPPGGRYEDLDGDGFSDDGPALPRDAAPAPKPRAASLLRVDQMRGEQDYESQVTYFRLRSNAGCWWMQF